MKLKKFGLAAIAATAVLAAASCGKSTPKTDYAKEIGNTADNDATLYDAALGDFKKVYADASSVVDTNERFAKMAKAEAELLYSGVFLPTTTRGGNYAISRVAYRSGTYALWGTDEYRYKDFLVTDKLIKKSDREELVSTYNKIKGTGTYHAAAEALLKAKGYTITDTYNYAYSEANETWDWLATSMASDSEVTTNLVDGLIEYDGENRMVPALAEKVPTGVYDKDSNTTTYTFKIKQGIKWAKNTDGSATDYEVTADDFVAGFQHMLDAAGGLEFLVQGTIVNASEYLAGTAKWEDVGVKATDKYTLEYKVIGNPSYFLTLLAYNIFQPMNRDYFLSQGGKFGLTEYADAAKSDSYKYGTTRDSVLTCGAFYTSAYADQAAIQFKQNPEYWAVKDADTKNDPKIKTINWVYNDGSDQLKAYNDAKSGTVSGAGLNTAATKQAKEDKVFDDYAYVSETGSTSYFAGNNLNRQTFVLSNGAVESPKSVQQAKDTTIAMNNQNFRLAINRAFDKATYNSVSVGDELKLNALRNMYTPYDFVALDKAVSIDGELFAANTLYGEMVQYFLNAKGVKDVDLHDGNNSWYNPTEAKAYMAKAMEELKGQISGEKIVIDIFYYNASATQTAGAKAYKDSIEGALGDWVTVNTVEATTTDDYYACGYRAANGAAANYDVFYGSGWGPDYGDPSTYLDTFLSDGAGYMTKVIGLW